MAEELLPYRAEYAKSSRASCRGCKEGITKEVLRLAIYVQSPVFDGRQTCWYHVDCFFKKQRPKAIGDFENIQSIRFEDQEKLKKLIESSTGIIEAPAKGKKRALKSNGALKDFTIEYAKSSRAICRGCELKIMKDEIRISKKDFDTEIGRKYGGQDMWHHVDCFAKLRSEMLFYAGADCLPGFATLSKPDQKDVLQKIPPIKLDDMPSEAKKMKEEMKDETDGKDNGEYKKQMKNLFSVRDKIKKAFNLKECQNILSYNNQYIPEGSDRVFDTLADIIYFGNLKPCPVCKTGQFIFSTDTYKCMGNLSEWTKCSNTTNTPEREMFKIPEKYAGAEMFKKYKCTLRNRIIQSFVKSVTVKKEIKKEEDGPKISREKPPLYNMEFFIHKTKASKDKIEKKIAKLGGKCTSKISANTMAVISTKDEMDVDESERNSKIKSAQKYNVHVVSEKFLDAIAKGQDYSDVIKANSICDWGSEPATRLPAAPSKSASVSKSKSYYSKSVSGPVKLKVKGGGAVDPDSGLDDIAHVYENGDDKYTIVLGKTDVQRNKNSFYKMQILKADAGNRFWLFRAWGRIGTTIGGNKVDQMSTLKEAIKNFKFYYTKETGNEWEDRKNFVKRPNMMYPIDVDYGEEIKEAKGLSVNDITSDSKLAKPVQDLVQMIFDVNTMKKTMAEFELDLEKMPLGKLSKKQIQAAFSVLSELQDLVSRSNPSEAQLIDCSNRFYTLIPHDFGVDAPPLIKTEEEIKKKLEMLDNLMELEVAYHMMEAVESEEGQHPIDQYYAQLKTNMEVLDKESEEFDLIEKYVQNTHAETHQQYELELLDVFKISRLGEDKRFKPFQKLPNRKLLWHGSRLTNFAGILSQGLRIAPPEAPVTGYMFGKGIYFADMVSKSANYCCTSKSNPTGLLLLCEVALGNMYERQQADYIEKLPKGKHSCKGVGRTEPDPNEIVKLDDGVEVPLGKGVKNSQANSALLYNEYIVYDVAQVKCKYLLKVNFKYKY